MDQLERLNRTAERVVEAVDKVKIVLDFEFCKECEICISVCPRGVYTKSENRNTRGYRYPIPSRIERCIQCRQCEILCPDFVISVITSRR
uniref:4Fe-4S dicluster domain-containing protein n=1 Tax=Fervidicoccus fontis TaxID=683846 RepID=A0A7J3ZLW3_9CREN